MRYQLIDFNQNQYKLTDELIGSNNVYILNEVALDKRVPIDTKY